MRGEGTAEVKDRQVTPKDQWCHSKGWVKKVSQENEKRNTRGTQPVRQSTTKGEIDSRSRFVTPSTSAEDHSVPCIMFAAGARGCTGALCMPSLIAYVAHREV